ncbi:non-hydrolyzing UDP-N-acetylglucosamine 2-epimerase [Gryllotalpicola koreensis]|uniref:UDP-N-acetylglucosamine 2-epimerase (non-hydrolyzing) n=1 Tax=Gryllotalpicola koreensis TaxID=993086 RepID=A0ABP8A012_9MICO
MRKSTASAPHLMVVYGTRPEAIKLAPVIRALRADRRFETTVAVTGQHGEILDRMNAFFGVPVDVDLGMLRPGQTFAELSSRMFAALLALFEERRPDAVLMHGDTSSSALAALAAYYQGVPVIHLEAGLRSHDLSSPFPEEGNRRIAGQLAALHLAPTATARDNLLAENVPDAAIAVTGNTVIDALFETVDRSAGRLTPAVRRAVAAGRRIVLVTAHRRESWGRGLRNTALALADVLDAHDDVTVALPMHPNPTVRDALLPVLGNRADTLLIEPQDYPEFCALLNAAHVVVTDSGGVQEEAPALGKPVLVTRDTTERPEAIEAGAAILVGTARESIRSHLDRLLDDRVAYAGMAGAISPYGDGHATGRVIAAIAAHFGVGSRVRDFHPLLQAADFGAVA